MAKKKNRDIENSTVNDGSHAIRRFTIGDFLIILILVILCLTCILPFIHLAAKSVSSNTAVMQRSVVLWPVGLNFDAYASIFQDGTLVHSFLYSVGVVLIFTAMPLGLNTIVFPAAYGGDENIGASMAVISNVIGLVTVPLMMQLM